MARLVQSSLTLAELLPSLLFSFGWGIAQVLAPVSPLFVWAWRWLSPSSSASARSLGQLVPLVFQSPERAFRQPDLADIDHGLWLNDLPESSSRIRWQATRAAFSAKQARVILVWIGYRRPLGCVCPPCSICRSPSEHPLRRLRCTVARRLPRRYSPCGPWRWPAA